MHRPWKVVYFSSILMNLNTITIKLAFSYNFLPMKLNSHRERHRKVSIKHLSKLNMRMVEKKKTIYSSWHLKILSHYLVGRGLQQLKWVTNSEDKCFSWGVRNETSIEKAEIIYNETSRPQLQQSLQTKRMKKDL